VIPVPSMRLLVHEGLSLHVEEAVSVLGSSVGTYLLSSCCTVRRLEGFSATLRDTEHHRRGYAKA
jgi:hypothetical protein